MTEQEWLSNTDVDKMTTFLYRGCRSRREERKGRHLLAACLRRIWHLLTDERCRVVPEYLEIEDVDEDRLWQENGQLLHKSSLDGWHAMADQADNEGYASPTLRAMPDAGLAAYDAMDGDWQCIGNARRAAVHYSIPQGAYPYPSREYRKAENDLEPREALVQIGFMRCIFGNPFRPTQIDAKCLQWNDELVPKLARAAYHERDLPSGHLDHARLAVLADALEESGCRNREILDHVRSAGPHVRGCWVVDLLLGKI